MFVSMFTSPLTIFLAGISPFAIILIVFWVIRAIINAGKKNKDRSKPNTQPRPNPAQPGKSIEDILRELERRTNPEVFESEPEPVYIPEIKAVEPEPTVESIRAIKHSDMEKHHVTEAKLHDGKFDDVDKRIRAMETYQIQSIDDNEETPVYTIEDMRKAVIYDAILNRPEF